MTGLVLALVLPLGPGHHREHRQDHQQHSLGDRLQLPDLLVQVGDVLLDDVRQLLDLHRLVVKNSPPPGGTSNTKCCRSMKFRDVPRNFGQMPLIILDKYLSEYQINASYII